MLMQGGGWGVLLLRVAVGVFAVLGGGGGGVLGDCHCFRMVNRYQLVDIARACKSQKILAKRLCEEG